MARTRNKMLEAETESAAQAFDDAANRALLYARHEKVGEVVRRILWASDHELSLVFGWQPASLCRNGDLHTLQPLFDTGFTARLHFAAHFGGYQMLDDGDPGLAWWRYNHDGDHTEVEACPPHAAGAQPYIIAYREASLGDFDQTALTPDSAIAVFNHAKRYLLDYYDSTVDGFRITEGIPVTPSVRTIRAWMTEENILPSLAEDPEG